MANRTDPAAKSIRGTNPQNLVEKILRSKIYQNTYWKEQCFGLTAETLVDKAMELDHLGGTHGGNRKPTPFMCLVMKMLQIQPEKEIVIEFIKNDDYKYLSLSLSIYVRVCALLELLFGCWETGGKGRKGEIFGVAGIFIEFIQRKLKKTEDYFVLNFALCWLMK